jgi:putative FmdB family regulatory protein
MPTYDYKCNSCGHRFELHQSMKDSPKRKCPQCGKNMLERLIGTGAAVIFKGSGFYQTDYRSDSYKKSAEAESKSASGTAQAAGASPASGNGAKAPTPTTPAPDTKTPAPTPPAASNPEKPRRPRKSKDSD